MATRVSWSPEEMIISLFMDETPLDCGSGDNLGARADVEQAGRTAGTPPRRRGDDQRDHVEHAEDVHVSASPEKARRSGAGGVGPQLVNRRILTFRMRPKAARVAIIEDPP
jgi:hypothetical protein